MAVTRVKYLQKALAGFEDLLFGQGTVLQVRNKLSVQIQKINALLIPYSGDTEDGDMVSIKDKIDYINSVKVTYDFDVDGGVQGDIELHTLPKNAVIIQAWYQIIEQFTSLSTARVSLGVASDDVQGILPDAYHNSLIYQIGFYNAKPNGLASNFTTQTTDERAVIMKIQDADLTAGKMILWFNYITGE